jgi:LmbE family N-acetylglucosaminyl deacetylase
VLSPHLDDAALSLGAAIARATRTGTTVHAVTVFAYDPGQAGPPQQWDAACGFGSVEEAARVRREEDVRACAILGAEPVWLPFPDVEYEPEHDEDRVWAAVGDATQGAEAVLIPGFPLAAPDHLWLTELLVRRPLPSARLGLYVEQPYAAWSRLSRGGRSGAAGLTLRQGLSNAMRITLRTPGSRQIMKPRLSDQLTTRLGSELHWGALEADRRDRRAKRKAIEEYRSQVAGFGPLVLQRIALYEAAWGGEAVAWVGDGRLSLNRPEFSSRTAARPSTGQR